MRATGISRRIDDLGRIVVPKTVMQQLGIKDGDLLEVYTEGNMLIYKKSENEFCQEKTKKVRIEMDVENSKPELSNEMVALIRALNNSGISISQTDVIFELEKI